MPIKEILGFTRKNPDKRAELVVQNFSFFCFMLQINKKTRPLPSGRLESNIVQEKCRSTKYKSNFESKC